MTTVASTPEAVDRTISATVRALYAGRGLSADDVARALRVSHGTINSRLRGTTSWSAREVRLLADYFGVRISDLYDGAGDLGLEPDGDSAVGHDAGLLPSVWCGILATMTGRSRAFDAAVYLVVALVALLLAVWISSSSGLVAVVLAAVALVLFVLALRAAWSEPKDQAAPH